MSELNRNHLNAIRHFTEILYDRNRSPDCLLSIVDICNSAKSINSHLIAKNCLKNISENGHVKTYSHNFFSIKIDEHIKFELKGTSKASTYKGFCKEHDHSIFLEIDKNNFRLNRDLAAKIALRAVSYELYKKSQALKAMSSIGIYDDNFNPEQAYESAVASIEIGARDFIYLFSECASDVSSLKYNNWKFVELLLNQTLPFSYSAPINFDVFPSYNKLEPSLNAVYPCMTISVLPREGKTHVSFVWKGPITAGFKTFFKRVTNSKLNLPEFLFQFGMEHIESIYIKPSWFDSLHKDHEKTIITLLDQNTHATQYNSLKINQRVLPEILPTISRRQTLTNTNSSTGRRVLKELLK